MAAICLSGPSPLYFYNEHNPFFLEQRRRTVRHFIKVEKVHWSRKTTLGA